MQCCSTDATSSTNLDDYLDFVHEATPVALAKQPTNKRFCIKVFKLVHMFTCAAQTDFEIDIAHQQPCTDERYTALVSRS